MKKIINGKTYNTETAREIAALYSSGLSKSDFRFWSEALYLTKKGVYFLHGEGGAMTQWATKNGDGSTSWGRDIVALSEAEALSWAENRAVNADVIETEFSHLIEEA